VYAHETEPPDPAVAENEYCVSAKAAVSTMLLPIVIVLVAEVPE
jgi:hypothetical protein